MWQMLVKPVADLFSKGLDVIDQIVPDKDLAAKIKAQVKDKMLSIAHTEFVTLMDSKTKIILAEAQGSFLQRNWRPILMLVIVTIVANNYLLYPYLALFWEKAPVLDLPDHLYALMKIGVGGYIVGRSGEKIAESLKKGD